MRLLRLLVGVSMVLSGCGSRDPLDRVRAELSVCFGEAPEQCGSPLALGAHPAGAPLPLELRLGNAGNGALKLERGEIVEGAGVELGEMPAEIAAGARALWAFTLTPLLGEGSATLLVVSNDADAKQQTYLLTFTGEPCVTGTTRACGSDVGACALGVSTCADAVWQPCEGDVRPIAETCNGADDDCDGDTDEEVSCDDGVFCNGAELCLDGQCVIDTFPGCTDPAAYPELNGPCRVGVCDEASAACVLAPASEGAACDDDVFCTSGELCQGGSCTGGVALDCSALDDACNVGACDEGTRRCVQTAKPSCECTAGVDADFDGSDQCADCDDRNGGVHPGGTELCNGIDDDCDGDVDEDFDGEPDGYTTCARDPSQRDCDDTRATVHPGAPEICDDGSGGQTGNGVDEDCDGYVDDGCQPCSATDTDGDGVSECAGDCAPSDPLRYPGRAEVCDGIDSDCNVFTVDNCGVSDRCNFDGDTNYANDPDVCRDDLLCACIVNRQGVCNNDYRCTSYCNGIETGGLGDLCAADERCALSVLRSANVHGCERVSDALGTTAGGVACADGAECRSLYCERLFNGSGQKTYCYAPCSSDAYCGAPGTVCKVRRGAEIEGQCWPQGRPETGSLAVGATCSSDDDCDHGFCTTDPTGARYCTEPCCQDTDCPSGFGCSVRGDQLATLYVRPRTGGPTCSTSVPCPDGLYCYQGSCAFRLTETAPMCLRDTSGQGARRAGAACAQSSDCASGFCAASTGTCIEVCCEDASCPVGLSCELQTVETRDGMASGARVCVNVSTEDVIERR